MRAPNNFLPHPFRGHLYVTCLDAISKMSKRKPFPGAAAAVEPAALLAHPQDRVKPARPDGQAASASGGRERHVKQRSGMMEVGQTLS
jgi:hypothetical protein